MPVRRYRYTSKVLTGSVIYKWAYITPKKYSSVLLKLKDYLLKFHNTNFNFKKIPDCAFYLNSIYATFFKYFLLTASAF